MKLAPIADPNVPFIVQEYAYKHKYDVLQVVAEAMSDNLLREIKSCIEYAKTKKCVEFCFHQLNLENSGRTFEPIWKISVIGFFPKTKN